MESNKISIISGAGLLIIGLLVGYIIGDRTNSHPMPDRCAQMQEHAGEHMHSDSEMHDHGSMNAMMDGMMSNLESQTGEAYEQTWLQEMIIHHEGAVHMAEDLLKKTDRPELVQLSDEIIDAQSDEIEMMEEWLEAWFNTSN